MFLATTKGTVRYGATFLITSGAFPFGAMTNAQVAANLLSDTSRSAGIGANVMMGNIGGLISTWACEFHQFPNLLDNFLLTFTCKPQKVLPFDGPN